MTIVSEYLTASIGEDGWLVYRRDPDGKCTPLAIVASEDDAVRDILDREHDDALCPDCGGELVLGDEGEPNRCCVESARSRYEDQEVDLAKEGW